MTPDAWTVAGAISQIVGSVVAALGIIYIALQIRDARRFTRAQLLNELEKESKDYRHAYQLITGEWKADREVNPQEDQLYEFFECLGFFERIKLLLDNKVINMPTIDIIFGYRFFLLINNPHIQKHILYPDGHSFTAVFALHKQWSEYRKAHNEEIVHSETDLSKHDPKQYNHFIDSYNKRK